MDGSSFHSSPSWRHRILFSSMLWSSFLLLGAVQLAASKVLSRRWENVAKKHSWVDIPKGWQLKQPASSNVFFDLKLGLKQHGMDDLIANLMEISNPAHSRFVH